MANDILHEERNCWKIAHASRLKFLIDGAAYFAALADAFEQARESIWIVGWDFDSRIHLKFPGVRDGASYPLAAILNSLAARRRDLHIYILVWDFAMIFALDRELLPFFGPDWRRHSRIHFHMDGNHPIGASHHSKIVVIDDALAFVGGLDLTKGRWDTPEHLPRDTRRVDFNGRYLPPYHDVQVAVAGEIAAAFGDLARERWRRATGQRPQEAVVKAARWPASLEPDLSDVDVAIARTEPEHAGYKAVREIEHLFQDAIAAARRCIYIENQYLSADAVGRALVESLSKQDGPEVVIVISQASHGWLETATMDVLRARLFKRLCDADRYRRLRVFCPTLKGEQKDCMIVHAKVLIADERFARVGSANVSNRSMGLDTETDLAFEAKGQTRVEEVIAKFRNSLLAEHLGVTPERIARQVAETGSLIGAVKASCGNPNRTLELVDCSVPTWLDQMIPESAIVDPELPLAPEKLVDEFVLSEKDGSASGSLLRGLLIVVALGLLAAAWHWTGLGQWADLASVSSWAASLQGSDTAPLWIVGAYLLAGISCFPVTIMILGVAYATDPWLAIVYSLIGCISSAMFLYGIGHLLGRKTVIRFAGRRLNRVNRVISTHGALAVAAARMLPVAPYSLVNLAAGAVQVPFRNFVLGTVLGMTPGVLGITLLETQFEEVIDSPNLATVFTLLAILLLMLAVIFGFRRWFAGRRFPGQLGTLRKQTPAQNG